MTTPSFNIPDGGKVTNQQIYFMLGKLMSDQHSTLELLKTFMEKTDKRWEHIYAKTDKLSNVVTWASGVAASVGAVCAFVIHKYFGL